MGGGAPRDLFFHKLPVQSRREGLTTGLLHTYTVCTEPLLCHRPTATPPTSHRSPPTVHFSPRAVHFSPPTVHFSPRAVHFSPHAPPAAHRPDIVSSDVGRPGAVLRLNSITSGFRPHSFVLHARSPAALLPLLGAVGWGSGLGAHGSRPVVRRSPPRFFRRPHRSCSPLPLTADFSAPPLASASARPLPSFAEPSSIVCLLTPAAAVHGLSPSCRLPGQRCTRSRRLSLRIFMKCIRRGDAIRRVFDADGDSCSERHDSATAATSSGDIPARLLLLLWTPPSPRLGLLPVPLL